MFNTAHLFVSSSELTLSNDRVSQPACRTLGVDSRLSRPRGAPVQTLAAEPRPVGRVWAGCGHSARLELPRAPPSPSCGPAPLPPRGLGACCLPPPPLQAHPGVGGQSDLMTQGFISLRCNLGHMDAWRAGLRDRPCPGPCQASAAGVALATAEGGRGPGRASGWSPGYGVLGVAAAVPGSAGHTEGLGLHPEGSGSLPLVREGARARRSRVLWQRPRRVRVSDGEQGTLAPSVLFQGMASLALRGGRDLHF